MTKRDLPPQPVGRLAMRREGNLWVAYYAQAHTMEGAVFMGSIQMGIVESNPGRKQRFMGIMQDAVKDLLHDITGIAPDFTEERPAPEHERAGRA